MSAELERERQALTKADTDIAEGQERMGRQVALIARMRLKEIDPGEGERLLALLGETLSQWEQHRVLIVERIAYLEGKESLPRSVPDGLSSNRNDVSGQETASRDQGIPSSPLR